MQKLLFLTLWKGMTFLKYPLTSTSIKFRKCRASSVTELFCRHSSHREDERFQKLTKVTKDNTWKQKLRPQLAVVNYALFVTNLPKSLAWKKVASSQLTINILKATWKIFISRTVRQSKPTWKVTRIQKKPTGLKKQNLRTKNDSCSRIKTGQCTSRN